MHSRVPLVRLVTPFVAIVGFVGFVGFASAAPGDLDLTFGSGGNVTTTNGMAYAVAVQPDGKIVVAGGFGDVFGSPGSPGRHFAVLRYDATGSLDSSFGTGGMISGYFGLDDEARTLALQRDGKIVVVVLSNGNFVLTRYNADGSPDESFGGGSPVVTPLPGAFNDPRGVALALQPDGKIIVAGDRRLGSSGDFAFATLRYHTDGSLDVTFGSAGTATTRFNEGQSNAVNAAAVQSDGKIIVAGSVLRASPFGIVFALTRYHPDGSLDIGFGEGGAVTTSLCSPGNDFAEAMALQSDGKIVLAGASYCLTEDNDLPARFALARYTRDGGLDGSFGTGGKVITDFNGAHFSNGYAVAVQGDGKIVVAGSSNAVTYSSVALARYGSDGRLDGSFGIGGLVTTNVGPTTNSGPGTLDVAYALALQPDGKMVAAGFSARGGPGGGTKIALARYEGDSALALSLVVNRQLFAPGDAVRIGITMSNSGPQVVADVYFGAVLPPEASAILVCAGGAPVALLANAFTRLIETCLPASAGAIEPLTPNMTIPTALPVTEVSHFDGVWPANAPAGPYIIFVALTRPGTLEILARAAVRVTFTSHSESDAVRRGATVSPSPPPKREMTFAVNR
jgi:uncharacterized delta-60 repeat protein/uncharacterized repeat protein (TIGR01451 family)